MRKGWESWDCSAWRRLGRDLISVYTYLVGGNEKKSQTLLSGPHWQDQRHWAQTEYRKFHLSTGKHIFTVRVVKPWHRLPGDIMESSSWANHPRWPCLGTEGWLDDLQRSLPTSAVLWFCHDRRQNTEWGRVLWCSSSCVYRSLHYHPHTVHFRTDCVQPVLAPYAPSCDGLFLCAMNPKTF